MSTGLKNLTFLMAGRLPRRLLLYALVLLSIVGPLIAVGLASHLINLSQQRARAESIADDILRRTERVSTQMRAAFQALEQPPDGIACSEAHMEVMRRVVVKSNTLIDVGFARGDELLCSSFGNKPMPLGPPSYASATGNLVRLEVAHPLQPDGRMLVVTAPQSGITVEIHEDTVLDISPKDADLSVNLLGWSKKRFMMHRGHFDLNRLEGHDKEFAASNYDGRSLIAWKRSSDADFAAVVVVGPAAIHRSWGRIAGLVAPLGVMICLCLLYVTRQFAAQQASLPTRIKRGLARNQFFLVYQPIIDLKTGQMVGAEALVRWRLDDGDLVSPDAFIPEAERHSLIDQITERVISLFEKDAKDWLGGFADFYIAINLSADDFGSEMLCSRLRKCIDRARIQPGQLHVEATERVLLNHATVKRNLTELRAEGIPTAIDDFGTGYSSLAYLTNLDIDYLKIDKAFIDTIGTQSVTSHVVAHIIELAKSLKLQIIAEGVETEHQANHLREHGVQFAQGWHFSRPLPIDKLIQLAQTQPEPLKSA